MKLSDFDYELPPGAIAQEPAAERDGARLLVHRIASDASEHRVVRDLPDLLAPGDLLVLNDTRVLASRLYARRESGGRVEFLLLRPLEEPQGERRGDGPRAWSALAHPARRLRAGERLALEGAPLFVRLHGRDREADGRPSMEWTLSLEEAGGRAVEAELAFEQAGHVPLPPYVERPDRAQDASRYQTVYAEHPGAVAAPTAGLHFTPELLARLEQGGVRLARVTLHVGPGTFQPVQCEEIEQHRMHAERFRLSSETVEAVRTTRAAGGRVVAVGTTVVRVLESCVDAAGELAPATGETRLFLYPGAQFRVVDALLTNFHLPRSTLLMLVSAFAGRERVLGLYRQAVESGYRFYSYGDALLLLP